MLPATAEPRFSAISILLLIDLIMSGFILISVVVSAWIYYKSEEEAIPAWVKKLYSFKCFRNDTENKVIDISKQDLKKVDLDANDQAEMITWQKVALKFDKASFIIYIVMLIIGNLTFIIDINSGT